MTRNLLLTLPVLLLLLACGGQDSPAPTVRIDPAGTEEATATFLEVENLQVGEADDAGPMAAGDAVGFRAPVPPACVTPSEVTPTSITWTYTNCTGPHGWTWNGRVTLAWQRNGDGTVLVKHTRENLVGTKDGKTLTLNGTRNALRNPATKVVLLTTDPGFTKTYSDGTTTRSATYSCSLTADWSEEGKRKLSGTWTMTPSTGDATTGTIASTTPLVWQRGCCHPQAGTLVVTQGTRTSTLVFGTPCGTVTVDGVAKTLGGCR
mgnify:CR=1 FL=1